MKLAFAVVIWQSSSMENDSSQTATKKDLLLLGSGIHDQIRDAENRLRNEMKAMQAELRNELSEKIDHAVDQINRGFQLTLEKLLPHYAPIDDFKDLEQRVDRVEDSLNISS